MKAVVKLKRAYYMKVTKRTAPIGTRGELLATRMFPGRVATATVPAAPADTERRALVKFEGFSCPKDVAYDDLEFDLSTLTKESAREKYLEIIEETDLG